MVTRYIKDAFVYGAGDTIVGQVRKVNEDNCGYSKTVNGELFVVCDGMGGHVGGATASRIAVDNIINYIVQHPTEDKRVVLKDALLFANMQILGAATQDPSLKGMGTTACVALIDGQNIWIAHVGDSRIYLYSDNEKYLYRITKDHSLVQGLVDRGELDDRDAEHHPQKNIILRALGTKQELEPEVDQAPIKMQVGDTLLICSDGLCGMIDDNEIETILRKDALSLEDKVQKLIDAANAPGKGKDNITVQLIQAQSSMENLSSHPNYNPKWRKKADSKQVRSTSIPQKGKTGAKKKKAAIIGASVAGGIMGVLILVLLIGFKGKFFQKENEPPRQSVQVIIPDETYNDMDTEETAEAEAGRAKAEKETAEAIAKEAEAKAKEAEEKARAAEARAAEAQARKREAEAKARAAEAQAKIREAEAKAKAAEAQAKIREAEAKAKEAEVKANEKITRSKQDRIEPMQEAQEEENVDMTIEENAGSPSNNLPIIKQCDVVKNKQQKFTDPEVLGLESAESKSIVWTSSNTEVVEISNFGDKRFKGLKPGNATISGKRDGREIYQIEVTVKEK